jgi:hypothetical protein
MQLSLTTLIIVLQNHSMPKQKHSYSNLELYGILIFFIFRLTQIYGRSQGFGFGIEQEGGNKKKTN